MFKYHGELIFEGHDPYTSVEVVKAGGLYTLHFGTAVAQSSMFLEDPYKVEMEYNQVMLLSLIYNPSPVKMLFLGLGAGAKQKIFWKHFESQIHTVEISPLVIDVGSRFFEIPKDSRMKIFQEDALQFLQNTEENSYDFIFVDLYDEQGMSPIVAEAPFFQHCRRIIHPQGVLVWNLWRSTQKYVMDNSIFHLAESFGQNYRFLKVEESLNYIVVAFADPNFKMEFNVLQSHAEALTRKTGLDFLSLLSKQTSLHF
jgi:spermidine synthase